MQRVWALPLLLFLVWCSGKGQADPPNARDVRAAAVQVKPPLVRYDSPEGRCSVVLPRFPAGEHDERTDTHVILTEGQAVYMAHRHGSSLAATLVGVDASLDKLRDGSAAEVQGSIEGEERIRCGKAPGREYIVLSKNRDFASRNRIFIASAGVYGVSFTTHRGSERSALATAFLDSFRIR
jgi:hypothetical protein